MKYAPVLIPTLNRYEHFKQCLESLEACTGADQTDVYVALDYPPSEKYVDGWKKIDAYLSHKVQSHKFRNLFITRRETNYFFTKGNLRSLINELPPDINAYISSEDDNIFSPCFLEFMNKSFEKYENNPRVSSICGFCNEQYSSYQEKNHIFIYDSSAWGWGFWKSKPRCSNNYVKEKFESVFNILKIYRRFPMLLNELFAMLAKNTSYGDASVSAYNIIEDKLQVRPSVSLVRNIGDDGSGLHTGRSGKYRVLEISKDKHYELADIAVERTKELDYAVYNNLMPNGFFIRVKQHLSIIKKIIRYTI